MKSKEKLFHANYRNFKIGSKKTKYKMIVGGYLGDIHDVLSVNNGMAFSSVDHDNDKWSGNCSKTYTGGWWYNNCGLPHPTGPWKSTNSGQGIN